MNKPAYIKSAEDRNKAIFNSEKVTMTPKAIRAMLEHAFDAGEKHGRQMQKNAANVSSMLDSILGKSRL